MNLSQDILQSIADHAESCQPKECCGLLLAADSGMEYVPCQNLSPDGDTFVLSPVDYAKAEDRAEVMAVVHSHVGGPNAPSTDDLAGIRISQLPWIIISIPSREYEVFYPEEVL